ncbi:glycosyltransferase [Capillimicrobium parvum]|uniref:Spore protein YkvP/CgeB glycosyl transferase-like domain-containing protein n=1 Tax=Capillimicrobium parvum TaxID=2884022 RepID=A0A9E6Y0V4_9ACTN|nr:glycosyltransferase [Capillimicrobium parvum]UGS38014.1 hypothetical protein DSM104329_04436 [Capillimicrobium parvum]
MRILGNGLEWLDCVAGLAAERHDVVALDRAAIRRAWAYPREDWWRAVVPDGWAPDVALFCSPEYHPVPPLIGALPCPVVLWVGDWYANWQAVSWIADQADLVLADATGVAALRRARVTDVVDVAECCPWTFDPRVHRPDWDAPAERDVGFLGNFNEAIQHERNRWLGRLTRLRPGIRVELGSGRFGADYVRFVQGSKIAFNFSLTGDVNMRAFEAPACGAMTLIDAGAAPEAARWFALGREVVVYDDGNIEALVEHYLHHDDERRAIARAGWERVQQHGPVQRLDQLLGHLESVARRRRPLDVARAGGRCAAHALSVRDDEVPESCELLLDPADRIDPSDGAVQVARAALYAALAGSGHPQAAEAVGWADEHLLRAIAADPGDAVARLSRAQLVSAAGQPEAGRAMALALADDLRAGRATAQPDRLPIVDTLAWRTRRQVPILSGADPRPDLSRLTLVAALRLAATLTADDLETRAALLAEALDRSGEDPVVRMELAICLLGLRPAEAVLHSAEVVERLPINVVGWQLHARALVSAGRPGEARAFVADRLEVTGRVRVDEGLLEGLHAIIAPLAATA